MRKLYIVGLVAVAALVIGIAVADEIKFSTYYPAPYGKYREFDTTGKTCLATDEWGIEGTNARVGIGTTDPGTAKLAVIGGNVGIGTTDPNASLHISTTGFGNKIMISNSDAVDDEIRGYLQLDPSDNGQLGLRDASNTNRVIIRSSGLSFFTGGNVGIGTTEPDKLFHVKNDSSANVVRIESSIDPASLFQNTLELFSTSASGSESPSLSFTRSDLGHMAVIEASDGAGDYGAHLNFFTRKTSGGFHRVMRMTDSGNVGIGTVSPDYPLEMGSGAYVSTGGVWENASSIEYKTDVAPLPLDKALETLTNLSPVTFGFKVARDERHVGFIAEEVPDLVASKDRKGLSPMNIVAVLTKVVQQQQKELRELKTEISRIKEVK